MTLLSRRKAPNEATLDREAERAREALRKIRGGQPLPGAGGEWMTLRRRRRQRKAVRILALFSFVVGTVAGGLGLVFGGREGFQWVRENTGIFGVQDVIVSGMEKLSRQEVIEAAGLRLGQDILKVDTDSVAFQVARLPLVKEVDARRTWKREVILTVVERKPLAAVLLDRLCEVDDEGVVLPDDPSGSVSDLTIIRGLDSGPVPAGSRIQSPGLLPALDLIATLSRPELGLETVISEIWAGERDSLVMFLLSNAVPVRVGRGDIPPRRLMAFRAVIEDLVAKNIDPEYLDLRFSGQIVVKPRPEPPEDGKTSGGKAGNRAPGADGRGRRSRHGLNT